ncbi:MAG: hypothetical protein QM756_37095 [Polyangiaceae bacterium]
MGAVALPWYVQAFARHGSAFTDRLLFYDMYKRAFVHVHDTNAGDDVSFRYYLWQLGYGLFPWTALALWGFLQSFQEGERRSALQQFLAVWCLIGFALFSVSLTKFHHYALPVAPPAAMLAGLALDRLLPNQSEDSAWRRRLLEVGAALCLSLGALWLMHGSLFGAPPRAEPTFVALGGACLLLGVAAFVWLLRAQRTEPPLGFDSARQGLFALSGAGLTLLIGRDLFTDGNVPGQVRLIHLFAYNYARPWPVSLDFEPAFCALSVVGSVLLALMLLPRFRETAGRVFVALGLCFSLFALDVYLVRAAPHYGQRETILSYYTTRSGPEEPLVAYRNELEGRELLHRQPLARLRHQRQQVSRLGH